uniref:Uncharacterized protein n=1 Tax=Anguilla anguilla TaxID=7936 RepID=A0A0E9WEZ2_ANGAN
MLIVRTVQSPLPPPRVRSNGVFGSAWLSRLIYSSEIIGKVLRCCL